MSSKDYFDQIADQWDQIRKSFFSDNVRQVAFKVAQISPGKIAADVGAGSGFMTEGLLQNGLRVIAIDQSLAMLEVMKKKFKNEANSIEFRSGKAGNLPLSNQEVDFIFANMYLHHVEAPALAIKEMVRALKKGGKLVITDLDEHQFEFLRTEQHDRWLGFKRQDIHDWFKQAGLKNVRVQGTGEECCSESNCECGEAVISIFVACGEK